MCVSSGARFQEISRNVGWVFIADKCPNFINWAYFETNVLQSTHFEQQFDVLRKIDTLMGGKNSQNEYRYCHVCKSLAGSSMNETFHKTPGILFLCKNLINLERQNYFHYCILNRSVSFHLRKLLKSYGC